MCLVWAWASFIRKAKAWNLFYCLKMKVILFYESYLLSVPLCSDEAAFIWKVHSCTKRDKNQSKPWQGDYEWLIKSSVYSLKRAMLWAVTKMCPFLFPSSPSSISYRTAKKPQQKQSTSVQTGLNLPSERIHSLIKYSAATTGSRLPAAIMHTCCLVLVARCIELIKKYRA